MLRFELQTSNKLSIHEDIQKSLHFNFEPFFIGFYIVFYIENSF